MVLLKSATMRSMKGSVTPSVGWDRGVFGRRVGLWSSGGPSRDVGAILLTRVLAMGLASFILVLFQFTVTWKLHVLGGQVL